MNALEIIGVLTGVVGVWLTLKQQVWCFPVGLLNVTISMFLFFQQQLYADTLQQAVYIPLLVYGWVNWKQQAADHFTPAWMSGKERIIAVLIILAGGLTLGGLLLRFTNAHFPWADSMATCAAFMAQYLVANKKMENWLLWMVVNIAYISIYMIKDLQLYAGLFSIYFILSILGYREWKQKLTVRHGEH
ncbi:MAG: nicotinamide riboside transporter PnuC [Bacteroidia bacterium]